MDDYFDAITYMSRGLREHNKDQNESKPVNVIVSTPHFGGFLEHMKNPCSEVPMGNWQDAVEAQINELTGNRKPWFDQDKVAAFTGINLLDAIGGPQAEDDLDLEISEDGSLEMDDSGIERIAKDLKERLNKPSDSLIEQRKKDGLCPQCGEKGAFAPISFAMTCSKHGAY
jgi:hypothetical protein